MSPGKIHRQLEHTLRVEHRTGEKQVNIMCHLHTMVCHPATVVAEQTPATEVEPKEIQCQRQRKGKTAHR